MPSDALVECTLASPLGPLTIRATAHGIVSLTFPPDDGETIEPWGTATAARGAKGPSGRAAVPAEGAGPSAGELGAASDDGTTEAARESVIMPGVASLLAEGSVSREAPDGEAAEGSIERRLACAHLRLAVHQLGEYFRGTRRGFEVSLAPGGTGFDRAVWTVLETIPAGETRTYTQVAELSGRPGLARAAGGAIGRNPIGILIPCHRVIGSNGSLTGFGGGIARKRWLLEHESGQSRLPGVAVEPTRPELPPRRRSRSRRA